MPEESSVSEELRKGGWPVPGPPWGGDRNITDATDADLLSYLYQVFDWMLTEREKVWYLPEPQRNPDGTHKLTGVAGGMVCQVALMALEELRRRSSA